ncbi:polysaccharide deacetylase family protein [Sphingomonas sp. DT-204]|uniref:polysaccharide deacetylase family protein n=1 Tax=Sphingomonas sp. DT-204 TaxID=3396166 RepID=UPI003F1A35E5
MLTRTLAIWLTALLACAAPLAAQKRIALSFDDVPRGRGAFLTPDQRTERLIAGLKQAGVRQAVFYVNPGRLATPDGANGEAHIAAYVAAGHVIANHSFSHQHLNAMPADAYLADIDRAEAWLKDRPGYRPWFRFPFLDEGSKDKAKRDAVRAGLKARGLANGYVTVDGSDWNMEGLTIAAVKAGKPIDMAALKALYVETLVGAADFYDDLARRTLGRSPAHVILLHETDLAALYITDLVEALRKDGWEIITADEAYRDPIASAEPDVPSANGPRSELMAWEKGLPAPRWYERDDVAVANRLFAERVLHEQGTQP